MSKSTIDRNSCHFTSRAGLVALGHKVRMLGIFKSIEERVKIRQKVINHTPGQKMLDCLINALAGGRGLVEINKRVRSDLAVQRAFGRDGCAEQSVISDTLNAASPENVQQMQDAMTEIYRRYSAGYRHDYGQQFQLLDIDMTGQPCGRKAAFATKGYFPEQRSRRGRQLGRVQATWYGEVVADRLYNGKTQLPLAFEELVQAAEEVLELDEDKRKRTILRADGGGGSEKDVNWALSRGYQLHTKVYSWDQARKLAGTVEVWHHDPKVPGRQIGWVPGETTKYARPVKRIAVRTRKKNGQWGVGVILSTLPAEVAVSLARLPVHLLQDPVAVLRAYVYFYDLRGGGVETAFREDKQGLGITKRNKKSFEAQQILVQLNALAHNLVVWSRRWLAHTSRWISQLGIVRMIRDFFHVNGQIHFNADGNIQRIILNQEDPFASSIRAGIRSLLDGQQTDVNLGQI
jgi:hypothetical protein